jgi:hypothetical protein
MWYNNTGPGQTPFKLKMSLHGIIFSNCILISIMYRLWHITVLGGNGNGLLTHLVVVR